MSSPWVVEFRIFSIKPLSVIFVCSSAIRNHIVMIIIDPTHQTVIYLISQLTAKVAKGETHMPLIDDFEINVFEISYRNKNASQ